jgi:hypothetical protein
MTILAGSQYDNDGRKELDHGGTEDTEKKRG